VVVAEAERAIGRHTSSRNTGVIHAGFHHPLDSVKRRLCRRAASYSTAIVPSRDPPQAIGKLVSAAIGSSADGVAALTRAARRGRAPWRS
jgi:L-2-hydroxyglutarate oxidase LhgO